VGRLTGKVAIVTGGARGMGAATSRLFVEEGAKVVIADVLDADGGKLAQELGAAALFQHLDVSDEANWAAVVAKAIDAFGKVDVLINNAGILLFKTLLETSKEEYLRVLQVNLMGMFLGLKAVAPHMIARGAGSIVNVSSTDGM
jgi:3alpha(or 20beta)-hydroxysteroid dehydrogenase